ncbi:hypothetical protein EVAR_52888_1 [Eumeta japonica]|uniref:Uncharacterized protein n=1 Tax=Eumeta variegata TaxID=151549 RepID=A0A4C1YP68_EUMVA|nr:hypothetical protein EVAR_52888_1 [Eumeta japonica]
MVCQWWGRRRERPGGALIALMQALRLHYIPIDACIISDGFRTKIISNEIQIDKSLPVYRLNIPPGGEDGDVDVHELRATCILCASRQDAHASLHFPRAFRNLITHQHVRTPASAAALIRAREPEALASNTSTPNPARTTPIRAKQVETEISGRRAPAPSRPGTRAGETKVGRRRFERNARVHYARAKSSLEWKWQFRFEMFIVVDNLTSALRDKRAGESSENSLSPLLMYSQSQNHQCVSGDLGSNIISDGGNIGLTVGEMGR